MMRWNAQLYDDAHRFISEYGQGILDLLAPKKNERILDVGCGTGDIANQLALLGVHVVGIDRSEAMIAEAKRKYSNMNFFVKNALELDFQNEFDAVFSNAVLHWIKPPDQVIQQIFKSLKNGGRFVAEFGGVGNVKQITESILIEKEKLGYFSNADDFPWYFPSIGEYTSMMEQCGFNVTFAQLIDRPTRLEGKNGLKSWLEMFADCFFGEVDESDKYTILKNIETSLANELFNVDHWIADYKRIRVIGIKK